MELFVGVVVIVAVAALVYINSRKPPQAEQSVQEEAPVAQESAPVAAEPAKEVTSETASKPAKAKKAPAAKKPAVKKAPAKKAPAKKTAPKKAVKTAKK